MTDVPDRKTAGYRITLAFDVPLGDVTWQFTTNANEIRFLIGDTVAVGPKPDPLRRRSPPAECPEYSLGLGR
jgi:hypothetical protein